VPDKLRAISIGCEGVRRNICISCSLGSRRAWLLSTRNDNCAAQMSVSSRRRFMLRLVKGCGDDQLLS
jgi:hypothetical protein